MPVKLATVTHVPPPPAVSPQGYGIPPGTPLLGQAPPGWYRPTPPVSPSGAPLASFADRLLAYILDSVILGGVAAACVIPSFLVLVFTQLPETQLEPDGSAPDMARFIGMTLLFYAVAIGATLLLSYVYSVEMMFRSGQTVGKRVMKIRVVPLDPAGGVLTRGMAARRWLVAHVASFLPGFAWLDGLWQLWDKPYQQCLHDKGARTVVVKLPAG
jgi:uncharacterized RDD family membrane protein YckC